MKFTHHLLRLVAMISVTWVAGASPLLAQSSTLAANSSLSSTGQPAPPPGAQRLRKVPADATATIDLGTNAVVTSTSRKGSFECVGLRHDQIVDVAVQYPAAKAGQTIAVDALDGGQIIAAAKNLTVGPDGAIHFKFRAGHLPGIYQIALRNGGQELGLQFWVRDEENPKNDPPVVNAGN